MLQTPFAGGNNILIKPLDQSLDQHIFKLRSFKNFDLDLLLFKKQLVRAPSVMD